MPQSVFWCRAKDSAAQMASAWRLVQVQQVYSVTMTIPLMLAADNLTDAQAQGDLIDDTASSGLSTALAAGLIAGESSSPHTFLFIVILLSYRLLYKYKVLQTFHLCNLQQGYGSTSESCQTQPPSRLGLHAFGVCHAWWVSLLIHTALWQPWWACDSCI